MRIHFFTASFFVAWKMLRGESACCLLPHPFPDVLHHIVHRFLCSSIADTFSRAQKMFFMDLYTATAATAMKTVLRARRVPLFRDPRSLSSRLQGLMHTGGGCPLPSLLPFLR